MPILQPQGVKTGTGTPMYIPAGGSPDIVVGNITVDGTATVASTLTAGAIQVPTGFVNVGDVDIGTVYTNIDGQGCPNISIDAKEDSSGNAYLDLVTQKLTTSTNLHRVRSLVGPTGSYILEHQTGAPGPLTPLQSMDWDAAGTEMRFNFGGAEAMLIKSSGVTAPAFVSLAGQNPNIATNAATTIFSIPAADLPQGKAAQAVIGLYFFDGAQTQSAFVTYVVNICRDGVATINGYAENQANADAALLAQTGQAWTLAIAGAAPQLDIIINTLAAPVPSGGWYCNYSYTLLGAQ